MKVMVPGELQCEVDDFLWPWERRTTPVLLQHGFARNARFWNRWVPPLARERRVYRPNVRGCGGSPFPPEDFRFSSESLVQDLLTVLDHFEIGRVDFVGEASGGILGMLLCLRAPERVRSLVLCNTPAKLPEAFRNGHALDAPSAPEAILKYGMREWCQRTIVSRLDTDRGGPELLAWYIDEIATTPDHVGAAFTAWLESVDLSSDLPRIGVPSLIITGKRSAAYVEAQRAMAGRLAAARVVEVEEAGASVAVLAADQCVTEALRFWHGVDGASAMASR